MRYFVTFDGRTFDVEIEGDALTVDGQPIDADLASAEPLRHILADGVSLPLLATPGESRGAWRIEAAGRRFDVDVVDERTKAIRAMTGAGRSARVAAVRAPMPGLIVRVEVAEGDTVAPGQGVVIMEAMKMENELKSDGGGVVARIHVEPGAAVEKGAVLVEFAAS